MSLDLEDSLLVEASSTEEARVQGAVRLGLDPSDLDVEVLGEEKRLFGLLGKKLKIKVAPKGPLEILRVRRCALDMLALMNLDIKASISEEGLVNLEGPDSGIVIGRYGETLRALEHLCNLMVNNQPGSPRVRFDCGGYREKREANLVRLARSAAASAVRRGRPVSLEPMSSWERRVIHMALKENDQVETKSVGEEPFRKVVVWPKRLDRRGSLGSGRSRRNRE
ncbi:putative RNA-binding protein [Thermanaerovibrio velox DSM 12556]|uniref:Putative RNA-binding protein n=1 Tax=Thermanaerovibrio velox DSM 12556 TaxID=926567 RepID=H0USC7_9BACT|nr:RNA-binding cell elongation regulator Jag/EloR [Thermanaerovibrio velox]EHM10216.1 putative RNA-binding protein [Thermanaerovibrio velox DSM 12556]